MKLTKRAISLLLCLVLAFTCLSGTLAAAADENPVIFVTGMNTVPLYLNKGGEDEKKVWPPQSDDIVSAVTDGLPALIKVAFNRNWDAACDAIVPLVNGILDPIALNDDGTSKYNVTCAQFDESYEYYSQNQDDEFFYAAREYGYDAANAIGADKVYVFTYDWRMPTTQNARELAQLVEKVKADTGYSKVTLAAISMGGAVTTTYLEMFGCGSVQNTVMLSSGFCGIELVGDLYSGRVQVDLGALLNKLVDGADSNSKADALTFLCTLLKAGGLVRILNSLCDKIITNTEDRLFKESLIPTFGTIAGVWGLVPNHDYADAKAFMFEGKANTPMMDEVDYYQNNVSAKSKDILKDCTDSGMFLTLLSNYGSQVMPFGDEALNHSDGVIETSQSSGGATCALIGKTLTEQQRAITASCGHNHVSPDNVINAATAMFPEQTWFVRNMAHTQFRTTGNTDTFIVWLICADAQLTVFDNAEYPQFMVLDRASQVISPLKGTMAKYYFIDDIKGLLTK